MKRSVLLLVLTLICVLTVSVGSVFAQATNDNQLSDPRVRQAMAYAIDMPAIIDALMSGKATPAYVMAPAGAWRAEGLNPYDYNPDKARELLKEAGWDSNRVLDVVYYYGDQM